jgi:hypothetical protein
LFWAAICQAGIDAFPAEAPNDGLPLIDGLGAGGYDVLGSVNDGAVDAVLTPVTLLLLPGAISLVGVLAAPLEPEAPSACGRVPIADALGVSIQ